MQRITVFLGPSLDKKAAEEILPATYLLPAKRGDLAAVVRGGSNIICLIDGVFHQESAVAHREILFALKSGVRVIGASSMGALRAAEMDTLGMEGVGEIYRMYKTGELVSDDEVALVFDPASGLSLSEPLINIRCTLKKAEQESVITPDSHTALLNGARSLFYPQRTYSAIISAAGNTLDERTRERFLAWVEKHSCDQKREDAIAALRYTRDSLNPVT
jgi:hypothetical protein